MKNTVDHLLYSKNYTPSPPQDKPPVVVFLLTSKIFAIFETSIFHES